MVFQVGLLAESSVTNITFVRPGAVVNVHVTLQIPGGGERLRTQVTLMWLLLENKRDF